MNKHHYLKDPNEVIKWISFHLGIDSDIFPMSHEISSKRILFDVQYKDDGYKLKIFFDKYDNFLVTNYEKNDFHVIKKFLTNILEGS